MKPYFAKYLPVEGEIKEGDNFLLLNDHSSGRLRTCYWVSPDMDAWSEKDQSWSDKQDGLYIDPKESNSWGFVYRNEAVKAKLFLCSRDIQVGDTLQANDGSGTFELIEFRKGSVNGKSIHSDGKVADAAILYTQLDTDYSKVLGEISPNATWVKEGDEFDEGEIAWKCDCGCDKPQAINNIRKSLEPYTDKVELPKGIYFILGPCGHFH